MTQRIDLDAIEARAKAATPGPWYADSHFTGDGHVVMADLRVAHLPDSEWTATEANAEHIAGMNPAMTLALVARIRELEARDE